MLAYSRVPIPLLLHRVINNGMHTVSIQRTFAVLTSSAADRNKQPILDVLKQYIDNAPRTLLELASGTGQHVSYFAPNFPNTLFQPSEIEDHYIESINFYVEQNKLSNVKAALKIDAAEPFSNWELPKEFRPGHIDYLLCINMIHRSSNAAVDALFINADSLLSKKDGLLISYGACAVNGQITPQSNVDFDRAIRAANPEHYLRDIVFLKEKAAASGLYLQKVHDMPANNKMLIFGRQPFPDVKISSESMVNYSTYYSSPIGKMKLASDGEFLIGLWFEGQKYFDDTVSKKLISSNDVSIFDSAKDWLDRYFAGKKPAVSELPLAPCGGEFRQKVWQIIRQIPYGQVITYGDIAKKMSQEMNKPNVSAQAVGGAVGHNPISVIIPCHRVVGANGSLTGYAGGIKKKLWLLTHEGVDMKNLTIPKKAIL